MAERWLSVEEFAERASIPARTVRGLCHRRQLVGAYRVGRRWRIDIDEYRSSQRPASAGAEGGTDAGAGLLRQVVASVCGRR